MRRPPFAFSNSYNATEDVLGLVSISVAGGSGAAEDLGSTQVLYTRIGTGHAWALLHVLPLVIGVVALVWLWAATRDI